MRWFGALSSLVLVACSGAEQQDVLAESPSGVTTTSPSSTSTSPSATTTTPAPAPSSPFTNCDQEKESNDTPKTANTINGAAICGTISNDSDVDVLTFKLKGGTKKMSLKFDGKVTLEITVGTQTVTLGNGQNPSIPFNKEQPYVITVRAIDKGATPTWRVEVVES